LLDTEYHLDYDAVFRTIRTADVATVRFATVPMRLLIDNRTSDIDGPMVKLVPRAASVEERFKSLKQLRPRFRLPKKISAIWWPRMVESLVETGVWAAIAERVAETGWDMEAELDAVLTELRRLERLEIVNAIEGEGYKNVWPAAR
jgi:hypothetical protein